MIVTTPGTQTTAALDDAPAGLTLTARLRDGTAILAAAVTVTPELDGHGDPLDAYRATFTAPMTLPVQIEWLEGATIVGQEVIAADPLTSFAPAVTSTLILDGVPAGLALSAVLVDGDETLPIVVNVLPVLDADGDELEAYAATFIVPADLPVQLVWLQDGTSEVGRELIRRPALIPFAAGGMLQPTAADIRLWGPPLFDWAAYGFPPGVSPDPLEVRVGWAIGELYAVTGRTLLSIVTPEDITVAQKVLAAFVIMEATGGGAAALAMMDQPWLKSFSAGSYSESRFSPAELGMAGGTSPPFPGWLWWMLWSLMTDDKRDEWRRLLNGTVKPAVAMVPVSFEPTGGWGGSAWGDGIQSFD
jgi:hypothetical protein